jgi:hypothetical protein
MPLRPRKCCGKKVKFTPRNMVINCTFRSFGFMFILNMRGNQWVHPAITAKTAPMDKT